MSTNKYDQLMDLIVDVYGNNCELTADKLESLVKRGVIAEADIDQALANSDMADEQITEIVAVATIYEDFMNGMELDEEENNNFKNSDEI